MAGWNLSLHNKRDITYWLLYKFKMKKLIALNNSTNARNYRLECNFGEGLKVVCYLYRKIEKFPEFERQLKISNRAVGH